MGKSLDLKDRKILYQLDLNARQSNAEIAKKTRLSKDAVGYRIKKLEEQGKKAHIFMANNLDINQFENFRIDSWINTACSGLAMDNPQIINLDELPK